MPAPKAITYDSDEILDRYVSRETLDQYFELLLKENKQINLVSRETAAGRSSDFRYLAAQSLLPLDVISSRVFETYLDIGSGGGFPAIPLILSGRIRAATLIERTQKKAAALRRICLSLGHRAEILPQSFEEVGFESQFDLITLRLVKLTSRLFSSVTGLLSPGGYFIHYSVSSMSDQSRHTSSTTYSRVAQNNDKVTHFTVYRQEM